MSETVSFVRIDPGDWKLPQDNQSVAGSAFTASSYILVDISIPAHGEECCEVDVIPVSAGGAEDANCH